MRRWIFPGILLLSCLAVLFLYVNAQRQLANSALSPSSNDRTGLSVLNEIGVRLGHSSIASWRKPMLELRELSGFDLLILFAPKQGYSERETRIISQYLESGGHILASFHDRKSRAPLEPLLSRFGLDTGWAEIKDFHDRVAFEVRPDSSRWPFVIDSKYAIYSRFVFGASTCQYRSSVECFFQTKAVGKGQFSIFLGYPPIINSLFGEAENSSLGLEILARYQSIAVDDYRNFFSDKTVWDLILEPSFSLPIVGLIVTILVFFVFGRLGALDAADGNMEPVDLIDSVHAFQESIFRGIVRGFDLRIRLGEQAHLLTRFFPEAKDEIQKETIQTISNPVEGMRKLVDLHKKLLRRRGAKI